MWFDVMCDVDSRGSAMCICDVMFAVKQTLKRHIEFFHEGIKPVRMAKWNYNRGTENEFGRKCPFKKKKSHHEMIFTITDAEILEPLQNKSKNDKTLED